MTGVQTCALPISGRDFYVHGLRALRARVPDMNSLVAVGTGAAFLYSLLATLAPGVLTRRGIAPDVSYEAGILEDPWYDSYDLKNRGYFCTLSCLPEDAPNKPEFVTLDFAQGNCVAVNGKRLSPLGVMRALNKLGGKHGVGRVDMVENRFVGMKSRGVYETPGGAILHFAHRQMESLTMDREVMHQRDALIPKYAELVYNGFWFAPEREALQAYVEESQKKIGRAHV